MNVYSFIQSHPWPEKWLQEQVENYNMDESTDFGETPWGRILLETCGMRLEGLGDVMDEACEKLKNATGLEKYLPVLLRTTTI